METTNCTFKDLLSGDTHYPSSLPGKIIIPKIQRDYAQGRKNKDIRQKRENFLKNIKECLVSDKEIFLDFIYGDVLESENAFLPLDGQQRLTTLFLHYLYAANKENIDESEYQFLKNFSYEIRPSSKQFCNTIVDKFKEIELEKNIKIEDKIIDASWFLGEWQNDPTISSMLVMLDAIHESFFDVDFLWDKLVNKKLIKFKFLELKSNNLTDDLYIKMNSRGKPLTQFEHFKAEFLSEIKEGVSEDESIRLGKLIDCDWTNLLWEKTKNKEDEKEKIVDNLFLNYFKFICDVICYKKGRTPLKRVDDDVDKKYDKYNEFNLLEIYFNHNNPDELKDNLNLVKEYFSFLEHDFLFDEFLTKEVDGEKAKINFDNVNILEDCLFNYISKKSGERQFSFGKFILLYAFIQFVLINKKKLEAKECLISDDEFRQRIRIINNLIKQSDNEMSDSEERSNGNTIPAILKQTEAIIFEGKIITNDQEILNEFKDETIASAITTNFNSLQLKEEIKKLEWRGEEENSSYLKTLNKLEDHDLLRGQIEIIGLDHKEVFDTFLDLFIPENYLEISKSMLTIDDYSRKENDWRYVIGTESDVSWREVFKNRGSGESGRTFSVTKTVLSQFLYKLKDTNRKIEDIIKIKDDYIKECENNSYYPWKYYFIKYDNFITNNGKYALNERNDYYSIQNMVTNTRYSSRSKQSYLFLCDESKLDKNDNGRRLIYDDFYIWCNKEGFKFYSFNGQYLKTMTIAQDNDVDKVDRIKYFKENIKTFLSSLKASILENKEE